MTVPYKTSKFTIVSVLTPRGQLKLGVAGVIHITEHPARGEGDRHHYDVYFGLPQTERYMRRIFDVVSAEFAPERER